MNIALAAIAALTLSAAAPLTAQAAAPSFNAHGSAEQVYVTGLPGGASASLLDAKGNTVLDQPADSLGGLLFRNVAPGNGYRVRRDSNGELSGPLTVHTNAAAPWDPGIYSQKINDNGYQYLTTRDGTKLAIYVHPPTDVASALPPGTAIPATPLGPRPTLIEYSGYAYARPPSEGGAQSSIEVLANLMGFTVVDVNMRGTGCSGGAFDFFEPLQSLDGYDVIETIARQPWVLDHKVGMMGISYGGISQLFTGQLNPPSLEAIAPLSVIDATATTLYPGGTLNTGFAVAWAQERVHDAQPAGPNTGQPWAYQQIQAGDATCKDNQVLHGEAADLMAKIAANAHYNPAVADPLDPITFVGKIRVPVFLACQWEDEQTGGHCPMLAEHFTGTNRKWFTFTNGPHIDSLVPATYDRWYDFLELFVAHQAPLTNPYDAFVHATAPVVFQAAMGLPPGDVVTLPPDPIQLQPTYNQALTAFEQLPVVRVLFDNGAGPAPAGKSSPGDPYAAFEQSFPALPAPGTTARTWFMGPGGTLNDRAASQAGFDHYRSDAGALPLTDYAPGGNTGSGGLWGNASQWQWQWQQNPSGTAVSYVSAPLAGSVAVVGAGAVHVWVRASTPDVDLQATVSEVRPDGSETFVQNGYLRASERKLSTSADNIFKQPSTLLEPIPTFTSADAAPLPAGEFVEVVIPLYYQGHVYRAGSRLRLTIAAPNGAQPVWAFAQPVPPLGSSATVSVEFSPSTPSSLVLPVVPLTAAPSALPPCPSLRNEPCRPYVPFTNAGGAA